MKNLLRALRIALGYRSMIASIVVSSLLVAIVWGGNIGALYPILEVTLRGQSLQRWIDDEIRRAEARASELSDRIERLENGGGANDDSSRKELSLLRADLATEGKALQARRWLRPYVYRYLPDDAFRTLVLIVVGLLAATLTKGILIFANSLLTARLLELVSLRLRRQLYDHSLRMDMRQYGEKRTAGMLSHFNLDIGLMCTAISAIIGRMLREPLKMIVCLIGAAFISWQLLICSLILTPLVLLLLRVLGRSIKRATRKSMEEVTRLLSVLTETLNGIRTVQGYTMEAYEARRFTAVSKACMRKALRIASLSAITRPVTETVGIAVVCIAVVAGGYLSLRSETHFLGIRLCERPLSIPALMVFFGFLVGASDPIRKLTDLFTVLHAGVAAADRFYGLLDQPPGIDSPARGRPLPRPHRTITLESVDFHYQPGKSVLDDVSLELRHGETVAIVGPNGCGKSTLVNLLPRFFDPVAGRVRWSGIDLREADLGELRRRISIVAQDTHVFDDTVANNIRYGDETADDERVREAAVRAQAHEFIVGRLSDGYETVVGQNGNRLSGGQRQRICLARAILRDPELLILDEATSQIDPESEQLIHDALREFKHGRTVLMVTHRASTLELADRILVMDQGRIVGQGTHQQLTEHCPLYTRLFKPDYKKSA